jgi:flavin reductase (DIM6/NTAB) family NADH-FMN oxidoreductase RutF
MAKVMVNPQPLICTTPTVLVGAVIEGKPNFMAVAWCGVACSIPPMVSVAIRPQRHTFKGIIAAREFSVNVPSVDQVREADYCGVASGAKVDKVAVCGFKVYYGKLRSAPLIEQCPVNLACKVEHILELGTHQLIIGRVEETHVTDTCLTNGVADMRKVRPFVFASAEPREYFAFGQSVGHAYTVGRELGREA